MFLIEWWSSSWKPVCSSSQESEPLNILGYWPGQFIVSAEGVADNPSKWIIRRYSLFCCRPDCAGVKDYPVHFRDYRPIQGEIKLNVGCQRMHQFRRDFLFLFLILFVFVSLVLGIIPRVWHIVGKQPVAEPQPSPIFYIFEAFVSSPGWPWTCDLPASVSQLAGITGMYHHGQPSQCGRDSVIVIVVKCLSLTGVITLLLQV